MTGPGRNKATIFDRVRDFGDNGMYVFDHKSKIMMCSFCNVRVAWERRSVITNHCSSSTHKSNKAKRAAENTRKRQASLNDTFEHAKKTQEDKDEFIKSTVNAFLRASIPLSKLDNECIREWMTKYIKGGGDLPSEKRIREKYVPQIKEDYEESVKKALKNKKIVVLCDERTDRKGQAVFIVLFRILPDENSAETTLLVAAVTVLEACTGELCSKAILQAVNKFEVKYEDVVAISSHSAAYMKLCVRLLRELMNPDLVHVQCWAHKLDKVNNIFSNKFPRLNESVSQHKKLFKNARKRRNKYMKLFNDKYKKNMKKNVKLFPMPVMTRFGSWKRFAVYVGDYVEDVVEYSKTLSGAEENAKVVEYFKSLSDEDIKIIKAEAAFVEEYNESVDSLLTLVEGGRYPLAHRLYQNFESSKQNLQF